MAMVLKNDSSTRTALMIWVFAISWVGVIDDNPGRWVKNREFNAQLESFDWFERTGTEPNDLT